MISSSTSDIFQQTSFQLATRRLLPSPFRRSRQCALSLALALLPIGCDRAPPEPSPPRPVASTAVENAVQSETTGADGEKSSTTSNPQAGSTGEQDCIDPLADTAPMSVESLLDCPDDPKPPPVMPMGKVSFPNTEEAPQLDVELALTLEHQQHGLMFRPELDDDEGMLFSYPDERPRRFWMRNTCLALDMIHIDQHNRIVGIVENVPPWNDTTRTTRCKAKHVLEVPAGWSRRYGVKPGDLVAIQNQASQ